MWLEFTKHFSVFQIWSSTAFFNNKVYLFLTFPSGGFCFAIYTRRWWVRWWDLSFFAMAVRRLSYIFLLVAFAISTKGLPFSKSLGWSYLWLIKPGQERFLDVSYSSLFLCLKCTNKSTKVIYAISVESSGEEIFNAKILGKLSRTFSTILSFKRSLPDIWIWLKSFINLFGYCVSPSPPFLSF